jgi:hypothetical protein
MFEMDAPDRGDDPAWRGDTLLDLAAYESGSGGSEPEGLMIPYRARTLARLIGFAVAIGLEVRAG